MQIRDYYKTLGVDKSATQSEIKKAFRALSMKYHPDRNQSKDAEEKFKEVSEAYEVLKDPERRRKYDDMKARPQGFGFDGFGGGGGGWQNVDFNFGNQRGGQASGFSDFFDLFFGGQGRDPRSASGVRPKRGRDQELEYSISLEDAYTGATKRLALDHTVRDASGGRRTEKRTYSVKIPAGITTGKKIRLAGQGSSGVGGGKAGDILLKVTLKEHALYSVDGSDLVARVSISPWQAALGDKIDFTMLDGKKIKLTVPEASSSGKRLRLRGKGLAKRDGSRGNLEVELQITLGDIDDNARVFYEALRDLDKSHDDS